MTALKIVREQLTESLADTLGRTYVLFPDSNTLRDSITKPTLILERTKVQKLAAAPLGFYENAMTLLLVDNRIDDEDHLDDLLDDVLEALDDQANILWSDASRSTFNGTNPAYQITLTAHSNRKAL